MIKKSQIHRAILTFALLLAFPIQAIASDLLDGIRAYDSGSYKAALGILEPLADAGDPSAQYTLGLIYHHGIEVKQDYPQSFGWLLLAAKKDVPQAAYVVAVMYAHGQGVSSDPKTAIQWYERAGKHGYSPAFHNPGVQYAQGRGTGVDYVTSLAYLIVAADLGSSSAAPKRDTLLDALSSGEIAAAKAKAQSISSSIVPAVAIPLPREQNLSTIKAGD
ncbi:MULTISPECIES: tetratricopeptide repeat protein [Xanthomonas]|uniref:tetratricopeptide repeat protein n=1 Tax=Xanthomonas TaxID=338 RepID=UPI001ADAEC2A|nr:MULTISPECIES: tetratricopeptide repeat protein [Xanthomonas]MBO9879815.1 sel1 repeat family protein [Xanthomonas sp. D-109]